MIRSLRKYRLAATLGVALTLAWGTRAYACTHGDVWYTPCGAAWYNFYQNVDVCACDCVGGDLYTNCAAI